jgi:hypothetical protein
VSTILVAGTEWNEPLGRNPKKPDAGVAMGSSPSNVATSTMNAIRLLSIAAASTSTVQRTSDDPVE